jgi:hypothetical protein
MEDALSTWLEGGRLFHRGETSEERDAFRAGWHACGLAAQQLAGADSAARVQRIMPEIRALAEIKLVSKGPYWLMMFDWRDKLRLIHEVASKVIK